MVERVADMPEGTLGFRASGPLTADDYRDVLVPPLREAIDRGEKIRLLFEIDEGFKETPGGLWEDMKAGLSLGAGHLSAWERTALVTDERWAREAVKLLGWLSPGELRVFALSERDDAARWLAA
jgi:hypothetical protein